MSKIEHLLDVWEDEGGAPFRPIGAMDIPATTTPSQEYIEGGQSAPREAWQPRLDGEPEINPFVNA